MKKVTLNLTKLLQEGKISSQEYDKFVLLSKTETKSHAYSIFFVLAASTVVIGLLGVFPNFFKSIWTTLLDVFGSRGLHFLAIVLTGVGAVVMGSGFLSTACAFTILTFLGNSGLFYSHASYFIWIKEPALTVISFSILALLTSLLSHRLASKQARVVIIFSRTCIFIVNLAFWIGSLWGDTRGSLKVSDSMFTGGWALALIAVGIWAAVKDKRWVVNSTAVFGSIHFYTQWFERLGATPGSLLTAGLMALALLYGFQRYNRSPRQTVVQ